ncbi:hypothetical protein PATSB16_14420 [Pandoraea thiooxydans]|nr:hypothetical protein PATSB16_14420 [Pandoraea thiooxydans]
MRAKMAVLRSTGRWRGAGGHGKTVKSYAKRPGIFAAPV